MAQALNNLDPFYMFLSLLWSKIAEIAKVEIGVVLIFRLGLFLFFSLFGVFSEIILIKSYICSVCMCHSVSVIDWMTVCLCVHFGTLCVYQKKKPLPQLYQWYAHNLLSMYIFFYKQPHFRYEKKNKEKLEKYRLPGWKMCTDIYKYFCKKPQQPDFWPAEHQIFAIIASG